MITINLCGLTSLTLGKQNTTEAPMSWILVGSNQIEWTTTELRTTATVYLHRTVCKS